MKLCRRHRHFSHFSCLLCCQPVRRGCCLSFPLLQSVQQLTHSSLGCRWLCSFSACFLHRRRHTFCSLSVRNHSLTTIIHLTTINRSCPDVVDDDDDNYRPPSSVSFNSFPLSQCCGQVRDQRGAHFDSLFSRNSCCCQRRCASAAVCFLFIIPLYSTRTHTHTQLESVVAPAPVLKLKLKL